MRDLQERRASLLLESELNRQALRLEVMRIQLTVDRVRQGIFSGQQLWKWVAPIAGFLVARKFNKAGTLAKGSALVSLGRSLWSAWRRRRSNGETPE